MPGVRAEQRGAERRQLRAASPASPAPLPVPGAAAAPEPPRPGGWGGRSERVAQRGNRRRSRTQRDGGGGGGRSQTGRLSRSSARKGTQSRRAEGMDRVTVLRLSTAPSSSSSSFFSLSLLLLSLLRRLPQNTHGVAPPPRRRHSAPSAPGGRRGLPAAGIPAPPGCWERGPASTPPQSRLGGPQPEPLGCRGCGQARGHAPELTSLRRVASGGLTPAGPTEGFTNMNSLMSETGEKQER